MCVVARGIYRFVLPLIDNQNKTVKDCNAMLLYSGVYASMREEKINEYVITVTWSSGERKANEYNSTEESKVVYAYMRIIVEKILSIPSKAS